MEFIDQLWDETFAGPKPNSLPRNNNKNVSISRTITLHRTGTVLPKISCDNFGESDLISPIGSITPDSPFSLKSDEDLKRLARKKGDGFERAEPRNPTVYDWIVISALDR